MGSVTVIRHPLALDRLTELRRRETGTARFRRLLHETGRFLIAEALADLPLTEAAIETPFAPMRAPRLASPPVAAISILRAGEGFLPALLEAFPDAPVGHLGLHRDPETLRPVSYYTSLPPALGDHLVLVLDPMIATGGTAVEALRRLKEAGARKLRFVSLIAAPEGLATLTTAHPDVRVFTAAVDEGLDARGHIVPGIGDAGDRLFGTE